MQKICEEGGLKFNFGRTVNEIIGENGKVKGVKLDNGTVLDADLVLVGIGIRPEASFAKHQIAQLPDGSIEVDPFLKTTNKDIFAAGDIANFPYWVTGDRIRVEHWNNSIQQGEVAAFNMLDKKIAYDHIPFFWSRFFNKGL